MKNVELTIDINGYERFFHLQLISMDMKNVALTIDIHGLRFFALPNDIVHLAFDNFVVNFPGNGPDSIFRAVNSRNYFIVNEPSVKNIKYVHFILKFIF